MILSKHRFLTGCSLSIAAVVFTISAHATAPSPQAIAVGATALSVPAPSGFVRWQH